MNTTTRRRFRPTRAGIVNLWDYTDETFSFADGRLVLRGANGSGKTKAMEVLFPFVLDGRLDTRRLDPFSGENRTMKENLLWRGDESALGYAWMELGDGEGFVTVGVGLRARRDQPTPTPWFFVADGRVGRGPDAGGTEGDIVLVDPDGRPRAKGPLAETLGEGVVVQRSSEHRRRVDDRLFGLGPERYESMLNLVLTLRRPMLAKDLDPRSLSETLAQGLRPLEDELLEQVSRSFDDLDAVQRDLERLVAADEAAQRFVTDYRGYLRTQARQRADAAIEAITTLTAADERRAAAHRALDEARAGEALAEAEAAGTAERLAAERARHDALLASDAYRSAGQLRDLERSVHDLDGAVSRAEASLADAAAGAAAAEAALADAERAHASAITEVERARPLMEVSAAAAGVAWTTEDGLAAGAEVRERAGGRATARQADIAAVRARLDALTDAERRLSLAEEVVERSDDALGAAATDLAAAEAGVTSARAALGTEVSSWADAHAAVVDGEDRSAVAAAVAEVGDAGAPGLAEVWRDRLDPRRTATDENRANLAAAAAALADQATALGERREAILDEADDAPPVLAWRGGGRDGRAGAPLWRLVRFADGVTAADAAGIEAALEGAGLLDAWVGPDGAVADGALDAFLVPAPALAGDAGAGDAGRVDPMPVDPRPVDAGAVDAGAGDAGPGDAEAGADAGAGAGKGVASDFREVGDTLAAVLVPEDSLEVPAGVVARVLASIRLASPGGVAEPGGQGATGSPGDAGGGGAPATGGPSAGSAGSTPVASVGRDGAYRLGPLAGAHRVAAPRYVGATARAAHRAERVAALDVELAALAAESAAVADRVKAVEAWLTAATAATAAVPRGAALAERLRAEERAAGRHQEARATLAIARAEAESRRRAVHDRRLALQREARSRELPTDDRDIEAAAGAVDRFGADATALAAALDLLAARSEAREAADDRVNAATAARRQAGADVGARRRERDSRSVELATLRQRMGADVEAVLAELADVDGAISGLDDEQRRLVEATQAAAAQRGQAEGEVGAASEAMAAARTVADIAERRLAVLGRPDLAGPLGLVLVPDVTATALLDAVDAVAVGVSASEDRRKAAQTRITRGLEDLEQALGAGYRPTWDVDDDVIVVTVADDLGVRAVGAFAEGLAAQRAEQEVLLTARERALFEDTLLTSVCGQIHTRTQSTRELVAAMDAEMRARRLSSGQTVGVAWRAVDTATPEWKIVHRMLDQDPAHFGPDQLDTLRLHFSVEIKAARAAEPQKPYRELLAKVLDYRSWRHFELVLVEADGREAPLTRARHARLSGGEKAASLHLPLFAAAHAAFAGARPDCPRLLALDEAFAGIDDQGRSELLSLTVAFNLDLFMTGYDLWAVERCVPGVAHYDLLHLTDDHAVSSLLVLWNGSELVEGPEADAALAAMAAPGGR